MPIQNGRKRFPFVPTYQTLTEVMVDSNLAAFGDTWANLIYSIYVSYKCKSLTGTRVGSRILSEALKQEDLRNLMPSRVTRHKLADAAEALLGYAWLKGVISINESIGLLLRGDEVIDAFTILLLEIKKRLESR